MSGCVALGLSNVGWCIVAEGLTLGQFLCVGFDLVVGMQPRDCSLGPLRPDIGIEICI